MGDQHPDSPISDISLGDCKKACNDRSPDCTGADFEGNGNSGTTCRLFRGDITTEDNNDFKTIVCSDGSEGGMFYIIHSEKKIVGRIRKIPPHTGLHHISDRKFPVQFLTELNFWTTPPANVIFWAAFPLFSNGIALSNAKVKFAETTIVRIK